MAEQLPLDFSASAAVRHRRALNAQPDGQQPLFEHVPNIDVHLHSPAEAVAQVQGSEPERTFVWLTSVVGGMRQLKSRRFAFSTTALDRLLHVRPPAQVTLDASAQAVARALWAHKAGLRPLRVRRERQRLLASSVRWPSGFRVQDAPWPAIAAITHLGLPLDVEAGARNLMHTKLANAGEHVAVAGLAGSAVLIETNRPELVESLGLPALAYAGEPSAGRYKMPLGAAECLLSEPTIKVSDDLAAAIRKATRKPRALKTAESFPWTLYGFQARDAAHALRILETTGGVLLAGDMGSGKTTVSLALADNLETWPLLVVAPLAAFSTWARQLGEMGRSYYIADETPAKSWKAIEEGDFDAVVISYDRLHAFSELVERYGFKAIVADELQRIRTPTSRRSRALRQLAGAVPIRIGLSGTPLQNRLEDLLPLGAFLVPGEWKPRASNKDLVDLYPGDPIQSVTEHLSTLMVRRRMDDTGVKLPGKTVRRVYVDLTPEQRRALEDLEAEAEAAKEEGELGTRMHVFARLQKMRQIVACPSLAGVPGPNPKLTSAIDLAEEYLDMGRKGIIFCANRKTWLDIRAALRAAGIKSTGIWGSSSVQERLAAERQFHDDPDTKVFVGTLASCAESLTLSPTATFCIFCDLSYSPSDLAQAEARAYRMNTTEPVDVTYLHARAPGGTIDDRMTELLNIKRALFAKVVDGDDSWSDTTQVHYSMGDLVYLLTGTRDDTLDALDADKAAKVAREQAAKAHARATAHGHKKSNADFVWDDGSIATILEDDAAGVTDDDLELFEVGDDDGFDVEEDDDENAEVIDNLDE